MKRKKIIREVYEAKLLKNERRIQKIAEESYKIRQAIALLDSIPENKPLTKGDMEAQAVAEISNAEAAPAVVEETNAVS